jgi:transglutaminase-like putative cysteine protease
MTVFVVNHITRYRYKKDIRLGLHRLMFRPRDSFDQRLIESKLTIDPTPTQVRWIHDVFGNCVTFADFEASSKQVEFESVIRLEHTPENAPDFRLEEYARLHPFSYDPEELPDLTPFMQQQCCDSEDDVKAWLRSFLDHERGHSTGGLLMTLNEAIAEGFSYSRRTTLGTQDPSTTLRLLRGTCRDFALLMIEAARALGFAARFVTGYVYVPERDGPQRLGGGSTHAWCQIYLPGSGWVEFDPTNGIVGNRDLIRVAVARTPNQAIPLSGTYWGDRDDEIGMEVEVNVNAE